ncbi:MAG: STAS domain-containing protein [Leptospirales bacterium]|nr:STAS domain-containing protein [Leptospirales bacterium]
MSDTLSYTVTEYDGIKLFEVTGYLSANTGMDFADFLGTVTNTDNVIIDMKSIDVVTSSGIESLVMASQSARKKNKRVILAALRPDIKEMFFSLSMYRFVIFAETAEEGLIKMQYYV